MKYIKIAELRKKAIAIDLCGEMDVLGARSREQQNGDTTEESPRETAR